MGYDGPQAAVEEGPTPDSYAHRQQERLRQWLPGRLPREKDIRLPRGNGRQPIQGVVRPSSGKSTEGAVVVMDNALYHSRRLETVQSTVSRKEVIQQ